ncbi:MAG: tetratricopeptide (TPR) repeat protein [Yoonia sp.]|jgi:tetratricopeptide (TPR) repeat protein
MLKVCASISLCLVVAQVTSHAQGYAPVAAPAGPAPAAAGMSAPTGGMFESHTFLEMANRAFDPSSDSMDFENGSFAWKGKTFNLTDQRAFRARFERFLLASPTEEEDNYARLMDDVLDRLSAMADHSDDAILETWEMLFRATNFDSDGGNSTIVANQVFNAWRIRKEMRGTAMTQRELADIRRYQQEVVANRALILEKIQEQKQKESVRMTSGDNAKGQADTGALPTEGAFRALELVETEAKLIAMEGQVALTGIQAKLQMQSQIVAFLVQRRYQHALVLSGFYQLLFKGSQQQLEVGKGELKSFFPNTDMVFTVDMMAFVANEAITDVNKGVSAVNTAYAEDRAIISLERLQETFFLGEYMPELNAIPVEQRRTLLDLYRDMMEAGELADAKDYNGVAEMAERIALVAKDFPKTRVLSSVETAKSMSDMAVFAASQYRNLGDIDRARAELQTAIDIWPSNPSIREFQQETTKLATAGSQGVQIFDDLYKRGDHRGIYEHRMDLGFALAEDTARRPLLMEVLEQVSMINLLVDQSAEALKQGDPYVAWELLAEAAKFDPNDAPMNRARAELAPRVADFVVYLDRAQRQAAEAQHAGSLAAFLAAQDIYPASRMCREGIERESSALMAQLSEQGAEAE